MQIQRTKFDMCIAYGIQDENVCTMSGSTNFIDSPAIVMAVAGLKCAIAYMACFRSPLKMPAFSYIVISLSLHMLILVCSMRTTLQLCSLTRAGVQVLATFPLA
jgi:hypothetical protein